MSSSPSIRRSAVTTHVLDTALGRPAAGVEVRLSRDGQALGEAVTDADGRAGALGPTELAPGTYELAFDVAAYARSTGQPCFFPRVAVAVSVAEDLGSSRHLHVPLLLSPFSYSTYRGS